MEEEVALEVAVMAEVVLQVGAAWAVAVKMVVEPREAVAAQKVAVTKEEEAHTVAAVWAMVVSVALQPVAAWAIKMTVTPVRPVVLIRRKMRVLQELRQIRVFQMMILKTISRFRDLSLS